MPGATALTAYLPKFLLSRFRRNSPCFILRIPWDIHVDNIFVYLRLEDIICLRRVNKAFFLLTHEPVIWKRFLQHINVPLPPLRPTFKYTLEATDHEVEQLVTRAISLEDNWRKQEPDITSSQIMLAHYKVLELKLLPGGKYLVASVKDSCSYRFFIVVFCLDHPQGYQALARAPTKSRAYNLQAKYMTYDSGSGPEQGIMIAYVRRTFKADGPANVDPNDYSFKTEIDAPHPFNHDLSCVFISLNCLEMLADPEILPGSADYKSRALRQKPPFLQVAVLTATYQMNNISLYELDNMPYLAVVQHPTLIAFIDLTNRNVYNLACHDHDDYPGLPHDIKAIRVFPTQRDILVVRTITFPDRTELHLVEIYNISNMQPIKVNWKNAESRYLIENQPASNVHISDYGIPTFTGDQPQLRASYDPPPPISIFVQTVNPTGVIHHVLWPSADYVPATSIRSASIRYYYTLEHVCFQSQHISSPLVTHVLPGAYRALMYTVMEDDRKDAPSMVSLRRYVNPEYQYADYPIPRVDRSTRILRKKHPVVPTNIYGSFPLDENCQRHYQDGGVAAITWDEGIGRVCIAAENEMQIQILDFAHVVQPDARFARWRRNQDMVIRDTPPDVLPIF